jgi:hypothetical protein
MKSLSAPRRRFLKVASIGAALGALAAFGVARFPYGTLRERLIGPDPDQAPVDLPDSILRTLMAVTTTVTDGRIERGHYEDYFRWQSETRPGCAGLYARACALIDREAEDRGGASFADSASADRAAILSRLADIRHSRARRAMSVLSDRNWLVLEEHVVQPVLTLFAETDAWVLVGYPAWRGVPRGFAFYWNTAAADRHGKRGGSING